jgi:hypothetical protein
MVDVRCPARAVQADATNPAARTTQFDTQLATWRQAGYHGAPCFPGHFDDVSRRTVDIRTPDYSRGHYHPRRVLLYIPPPAGFFPSDIESVVWDNRGQPVFAHLFEELVSTREVNGVSVPVHVYRNKTADGDLFKTVRITGIITLTDPGIHRFEGLILNNALRVSEGYVELANCAARRIEIDTTDTVLPVLDARDSLIKSVKVEHGLSRLEYCTVLAEIWTLALQASDALFFGRLRGKAAPTTEPPPGCVRYSRIPPEQNIDGLSVFRLTRAGVTLFSSIFGQRGCGVLHPATHSSVLEGAEDGSELGAYHRRRYSLAITAVYRKLQDFLPLGQEAVVIPDIRLLHEPPVA